MAGKSIGVFLALPSQFVYHSALVYGYYPFRFWKASIHTQPQWEASEQ
jgi:hypothetical protein